MKQYKDFLRHILDNGTPKTDRTGTGTLSTFGYQMRYNFRSGFPILTTKKVAFNAVVHELIWFIKGDTNIKYLVDNGVRIWNEWPYEKFKNSEYYNGETLEEFVEKIKNCTEGTPTHKFGELGPVYGKQWRDFNGFDQLKWVIDEIRTNPHSRRLIVNSWNPPQLKDMALPPCHMMYQFYVNDGKLSLQLYQRSADAFLGVPFNISSYSLLLMMVAQVTGLEVGEFIHTIGDAHIYNDHFEQVELQLSRHEKIRPTIWINPEVKEIDDFTFEDVKLIAYSPHDAIRAKVSV